MSTKKSFTEMVEFINQKKEFQTKKALAEFLGAQPATLSAALKSDSEGSPYGGGILETAQREYDKLQAKKSPTTRKVPTGRLSRLQKADDLSWSAELGQQTLRIVQAEPKHWVAKPKKGGEPIAEASTFKDIVGKLREIARAS